MVRMVATKQAVSKFNVEKRRGVVLIVKERCKGCGLCVAFCPMKILKLSDKVNSRSYHYPEVIEEPPNKVCINCGMCMNICPDFAIYAVSLEDYLRMKEAGMISSDTY